jgi:hypothetical protein
MKMYLNGASFPYKNIDSNACLYYYKNNSYSHKSTRRDKMELRITDSEYILRNEYKQLLEKDNVFVKTKNIVSKTSSVTREYILIAFILNKISKYIYLFELALKGKSKDKDLLKTYNKLMKLNITFKEYLNLYEKSCIEAWEKVFVSSPDLVQQYFFDEELKVDKNNIATILKELIYHIYKEIEPEDSVKESTVRDFYSVMKKMISEVYKC